MKVRKVNIESDGMRMIFFLSFSCMGIGGRKEARKPPSATKEVVTRVSFIFAYNLVSRTRLRSSNSKRNFSSTDSQEALESSPTSHPISDSALVAYLSNLISRA